MQAQWAYGPMPGGVLPLRQQIMTREESERI